MQNLDNLEFTIKINGKDYENDAIDSLRVDRTNLDEEFATQHVKFAYYSTLHEMAKDKVNRLKMAIETVYAQLDHEKRSAATKLQEVNPKFKYTETMCENEIKTDPRYLSKQNEYLDAQQLSGMLGALRDAFLQRKDMLISLGANARNGSADLRIMGDRAKYETQTKATSRRKPKED
jgi:hypothetical protein